MIDPEATFARGAAALETGDLAAAERLFGAIVSAMPRAHPAWNALSVVASRSGNPDLALEHARAALAYERRNPIYLNNFGVALGELGRFKESEDAFRRAVRAKPIYPEGWFNLGKVLGKQADIGSSVRAYERAYAMQPDFPGLRNALAESYRLQGRSGDALTVLCEADRPRQPELAALAAECLSDLHGDQRAIEWLGSVVEAIPACASARLGLGLLQLRSARWLEGWQGYTWRRAAWHGEARQPPAALPRDLAAKRVCVRGEQGIGDVLLFLRFAADLKQRGAEVILSCTRRLGAILKCGQYFDEWHDEDAGLSETAFDCDLWLGNLPAALEAVCVPAAVPLQASEETLARMRARLAELGAGPYLGLAWRAGTDTLRQREFGNRLNVLMKELPPSAMGSAVRGWPGTLISLQRGPYEGEIASVAAAAGQPVHDLGSCSEDLAELLALLALLDEYVAVSSTNMHMLAGLRRGARVLVPFPPEWRWMRSGGSPWFPGFSVYRQPQGQDWTAPLAQLRSDLYGQGR